MIIDFTIENFRSIKTEQLLSLFAENKPKHHAGNIAYIGNDNLGILRTCTIYGSNAAGKTNIIKAFEALVYLVCDSGDLKEGDLITAYDPYLLSNTTKDEPIRFDIEFYAGEQRYRYQVTFTQLEILYEKLEYFPNTRAAVLFERNSPSQWKSVKFGEHYKGGTRQVPFFSNSTYLAKAGNRPDTPNLIRDVYDFFRKKTMTVSFNKTVGVFDWDQDKSICSIINTFLQKADLGINRFELEKKEVGDLRFPEGMPEDIKKKLIQEFSKNSFFLHEMDNGELVRLENKQESSGTRRLFKLLPFFIKILRDGAVLFIDEIESSFHPHLAELIIKLFNDPLVNKQYAQLIFTTHDLTLMSPNTMRKDQIYLVSKTIQEGTTIQSLDDFESSLKDQSPFAKWYNEGRLGAIPSINYRDISEALKGSF